MPASVEDATNPIFLARRYYGPREGNTREQLQRMILSTLAVSRLKEHAQVRSK